MIISDSSLLFTEIELLRTRAIDSAWSISGPGLARRIDFWLVGAGNLVSGVPEPQIFRSRGGRRA